MPTYDKDKIGKMLAWRGDHFVYEYGENEVIKFSKFDYLLGFEKAKEVVPQEYETFKEFFGEYLVSCTVVLSPVGHRVAVIQPRLSGKNLQISDLQSDTVKIQCRDIIERYHRLVAAGHPAIDLMGHEGLFHFWDRCLGNILVTDDGKLRIFDAMSLELKRFAPFTRPFMALLFRLDRVVQKSVIRAFEKASAGGV